MKRAATEYLEAGVCTLPVNGNVKRPAVSWKQYQSRLPTPDESSDWWPKFPRLCVVCGAVSGNMEAIDFDVSGLLYGPWCDLLQDRVPEVVDKLFIEKTPSGGVHAVYCCEEPVDGSLKLASIRKEDGSLECAIETRGEGGLIVCAPSEGYEAMQGSLAALPVITKDQRDTLIHCARELHQGQTADKYDTSRHVCASLDGFDGDRPGDIYNREGDFQSVLSSHGWRPIKQVGQNEHWCRPGKDGSETSATVKDRLFYIFSTNADPFEAGKAYLPFQILTFLSFKGDFEKAAASLDTASSRVEVDIDLEEYLANFAGQKTPDIPGTPVELLRCPGFISEHIDQTLKTAPYPNPVMAFCGAITMQGVMCGRKVRDSGDNRTNLYICGLAESASGKDWPRKMNKALAYEADCGHLLGDWIGSGEGMQDALYRSPATLWQIDEFDYLLQGFSAGESRWQTTVSFLMTFYSQASASVKLRDLAQQDPRYVHQPCACIFGTAIPRHYYESLGSNMLTSGFFARLIIVESGKRARFQEPSLCEPTKRMVATAKHWKDYGVNNLVATEFPQPDTAEHTQKAKARLFEVSEYADDEYAKCEDIQDSVGMAVWGRCSENIRKLALIYACSENYMRPSISEAAIQWAYDFVIIQIKRALFKAGRQVADNPYQKTLLKILTLIDEYDGVYPHSDLLRTVCLDAKEFKLYINTLHERREIRIIEMPKKAKQGPKKIGYAIDYMKEKS